MHKYLACSCLLLASAAGCGGTREPDPHLSFDMRPQQSGLPMGMPLQTSRIAQMNGPHVVVVNAGERQGSGVIVDGAQSLVVTNAHVVGDEVTVKVVMRDGRELEGSVVAKNVDHDLAIVAVVACRCSGVTLGDDAALQPGDAVVAIGAPLGLEQTVSSGNVSAIRVADGLRVLQITVPISPGSSGGGLFDDRGRLVGITTATATLGQNINFAMPIAAVRALLATVPPRTKTPSTP